MQLLEQRIVEQGKVIGSDVVKVDMFLNHQMDVELLCEIGKEFHRLFASCNIDKILTVEASGIGIACLTAQYFPVPVVFAKKGVHSNVGTKLYTSTVHSFTKNVDTVIGVSKDYIKEGEKILIIDDFLANGEACKGMMDIIEQAGATLAGIGIVVEKGFQPGGQQLRSEGIKLESLAIIESIDGGKIVFRK